MSDIVYNNAYTATIVAAAPELGVAFVQPTYGSPTASTLVLALYPHLSDSPGALWMTAYSAGSTVVCTRGYLNGMEVAFITGICNITKDALDNSGDYRLLYNAEKFTQSCKDSKSILRLLERMRNNLQTSWVRNYANGAPADMLPGDADILDKASTVGLHVGRYVSGLHGSSTAFVDVGRMDDKLRLVGNIIEMHNVCMERVLDRFQSIVNLAACPREAFGLASETPLIQDEEQETLTLRSETAIPLYRMQHMGGAVIQGMEEVILGLPKDNGADAAQHDADHEPPAMARRRMDLTGELSGASVHSLSSVKTPFIPIVTQLGYGGEAASGKPYDDLREPHTAEPPANEEPDIPEKDDDQMVTDAAIHKLVDNLLSGSYKEAMLRVLREHGLSFTNSRTALTGQVCDPELVGGYTAKQQYDLPEAIDITDPVTGRTQRYYASMSFITQERDGSICICDGYGSEIRMCRGNIYISPALDLIMRPGRDFSVMAAGHASVNAQGTITVNSSDALFMRAVNSLKIAGATGGKGVVTLESDAKEGPKGTGLPGMVLRSDSNLSMTASNEMYIGRNSNHGDGRERVTEPDSPGSIIIDAGANGTCYTRSKSITVDSSELTAGAFGTTYATADSGDGSDSISGTAITMNVNSIGIYAPKVTMPASLNMKSLVSTMQVPLVRDGMARTAMVDTDPQPSLEVQANGLFGQNLTVNGNGKFNGYGKPGHALHAYGLLTTKNVIKLPPRSAATQRHFRPEDIEPTPLSEAPAADKAAEGASKASSVVYQDWFVFGNKFAFPDTYNRDVTVVPGMVWQERSRNLASKGDAWSEQYINDSNGAPTACYPGYRIWENANVSSRDTKTVLKLNSGGYVTNAKHEEV